MTKMLNESSLNFLHSNNQIKFLFCVKFVLKETKRKTKKKNCINTTIFVRVYKTIYQILANIEHH